MAKRKMKEDAKARILRAAANSAQIAEESGDIELAKEIRIEATRLAARYGFREVHGLPETFKAGF